MSHMMRRCPCLQTATKIPEIEKRANILFLDSGPAFFQRSTQVFRHFSSSLCSETFSQATSSEIELSALLVAGSDVGFVYVIISAITSMRFVCIHTVFNALATSSLNWFTCSMLSQYGKGSCRSSERGIPCRNDESTSFKELLPSMDSSIDGMSTASSFKRYKQGGQRCVFSPRADER